MSHAVIFPGTFDPITYGHIDIVKRSLKMFDRVIVAVAGNDPKNPLCPLDVRMDLCRTCLAGLGDVEVESFSGLLVDYAIAKKTRTLIRGIRAVSDFEYEFQMALTNRKIGPDIDTIFLMPDEKYSYVSSRMIKEICRLGGDVSSFVPPVVENYIKQQYG